MQRRKTTASPPAEKAPPSRGRGWLAALLLVPLFAACSFLPGTAAKQVAAPEAARSEKASRDAPTEPTEWWREFGDPALDQIIAATLGSNFDLDEAVARVAQARARLRVAKGIQLPAIQPTIGRDDARSPTNAGLGAQLDAVGLDQDAFQAFGFQPRERIDLATYSVGAQFAYEVDFWGRDRKATLAAEAESLAANWDLETARIGILAQTVATYLEVVDLRRQRALAARSAELAEEWEWFTAERYAAGLVPSAALHNVQRQAHEAKAQLPGVEAQLADAEARLWILVGGERDDLAALLPDALAPSWWQAPVPTHLPVDLLAQRPDVQAAQQRAEAARHAVRAREAELLPALSLSGSIGLASAESGTWFEPDQWFRNLTANVLSPVLQRGRLLGNVEVAEAERNAAVAAYGRSVLTAAHEAESALAGLAASHDRLELLASHNEAARAEASLRQRRYASGLDDYGAALRASRLALTAESSHASGIREAALARLALHRAVGGAWAR